MKTYTLLQAISEIERIMPFKAVDLGSIAYEDGSKNKFIISLLNGETWFINLDDFSYRILN